MKYGNVITKFSGIDSLLNFLRYEAPRSYVRFERAEAPL